MISFSEAQQLVLEQARSFGNEKVSLDSAAGRVISETIIADRDYPPFNRAAMDGYAIRQTDWDIGIRAFLITEVLFAGSVHKSGIGKGECYKIMTGASVPESADAIIRREDVTERSDRIECLIDDVKPYQHIAQRGGDLRKDAVIFSSAVLCSAANVAVLASIGKYEVIVAKLPRVSIITTGDEIVDIDRAVSQVQIRNSNRHVLKVCLKKWNIVPVTCVHVQDLVHEIELAIAGALSSDMIIICGGVSAGDADYVPDVLHKVGGEKIFHKVAIKPGKPIWFGKFKNGSTVFALPGNPLSCLVTYKLFIEYFLVHSFGLGEPFQLALPLKGTRSKKSQLDEFFPVNIAGTPSSYTTIPFNGSGDITAALCATAIARHPAMMPELSENTIVNAYPLL